VSHENPLPACPVGQDQERLPQPNNSTSTSPALSGLPPLSHFTFCSNLETRYLIFQNLPWNLEVSFNNIVEGLNAPAAEGGCGISIMSYASIPSVESAAFVIEFASMHEARIAMAGWRSRHSATYVGPAPSSLLSTTTLVPYQQPLGGTLRHRFNKRSTPQVCSQQFTMPRASRRESMASHHGSQRFSPYSTFRDRQPNSSVPSRGDENFIERRRHNYFGYIQRKGLRNLADVAPSWGSTHQRLDFPGR
jgi:hypothetical protein